MPNRTKRVDNHIADDKCSEGSALCVQDLNSETCSTYKGSELGCISTNVIGFVWLGTGFQKNTGNDSGTWRRKKYKFYYFFNECCTRESS